jgi:hypothetical protein
MAKRISARLVLFCALFFLIATAALALGGWENPDECTEFDTYTWDGNTYECELLVMQETRCTYTCDPSPPFGT